VTGEINLAYPGPALDRRGSRRHIRLSEYDLRIGHPAETLGEVVGLPLQHGPELGLRHLEGDAAPEPGDAPVAEAGVTVLVIHDERRPQPGVTGELEPRRHDAHDLPVDAVQAHAVAEDLRIGTKAALPESVADEHDRIRRRPP